MSFKKTTVLPSLRKSSCLVLAALCVLSLLASCADVGTQPKPPLSGMDGSASEAPVNDPSAGEPIETKLETTTGKSPDELTLSPGQAFESVLKNETTFICMYQHNVPIIQKEVNIYDAVYENDSRMRDQTYDNSDYAPKFAMTDLNGDGMPEIVFEQPYYAGFVVLRYREGRIYGNQIPFRAFRFLKKDGTFWMSSGALDNTIAKLVFLGEYLSYSGIAWSSLGGDTVYYYNYDIPTDKDAFDRFVSLYKAKPDVDWHVYSDESVRQWLADNAGVFDAFPQPSAASVEKQKHLDSLAHLLAPNGVIDEGGYESYYDSWNEAMNGVYELCLNGLSKADSDSLRTDQLEWLELRDQASKDLSESTTVDAQIGDMTERRTYRLIDFYFDGAFDDG